ncbi:MAG: xanthine dehydrogenase family protein molybdopterin-binding subunit [Candidatus Promineifilaceae bacterium]
MTDYQYLGKPRKLIDGLEKVTGHVRYPADLALPGMLYARPVLSPYAHAGILSIDTQAATAMPGVVAVLTAQDLPTRHRAITSRNSAVLARDKVLWRGQPVAVVVGESEAAAQDAVEQVIVTYAPLPVVADALTAMQPDAPTIWSNGLPREESDFTAVHTNESVANRASQENPNNVHAVSHFQRGDLQQGWAEADLILEHTYHLSMVHQGYLEPHACVAEPDPFGQSVTLYTSTQGQFLVREEVARLLSWPESRVRIVPLAVGGGFGAKYGIVEPLAAGIALTVRQPVRLVFTRSEDFLATTPAPAIVIELKTGARHDGTLTALQARVILDNGIFSFGLGGIVAALLGGYYKWPNLHIECLEVNTHKPQIGAYRAPGAPQATFAIESQMDEIAAALGLDPLAFRLQNAVNEGDLTGTGRPWPKIGLQQCLEQLQQHPSWQNRAQKAAGEGIGIAVGGWPSAVEPSAAICRVDSDGTVSIQVGVVDISGVNSSTVLVAAEVLGVHPDQVRLIQGDTNSGPFGPASGGSQVTYSLSGAVAKAAEEARKKLVKVAADQFEAAEADIEIVNGQARVRGVPDRTLSLAHLVGIAQSKRGGVGPIVGEGNAAVAQNAPGFAAHLVKVRVDAETGQVMPLQYIAFQDVGFALNPLLVEGQMHGGMAQGLSLGLYEAMVYNAEGQLLSGSLMDYALPRADMLPPLEAHLVQNPSPLGPFGARGVGEPPITAGAAALANAIKDATGVRLTRLPLTAESVWQALRTQKATETQE